jgi:cytoskeletal protein CcmA (bactofilin family)
MRGDEQAVIGAGTRIRGAVRGAEPVRIEGRVDGPVEVDASVAVEAGGIVCGEVSATEIVVAGIVVGDLNARERLVLRPTAQVRGGLHAPKLVLEAGARVDGPLRVGHAEGLPAPAERPRPVVMAVRPIPEADTEEPAPVGEEESDEARRTRVVVKKRP